MKVKELVKKLQNIKEELQDKEVYVLNEHGLVAPPEIKFALKGNSMFDKSKENVGYIVLS